QDNAFPGFTGNVFLDAYKLDGTRLWRIDLGRNIRAGAHYTQFMVYDLDGDGRAELACKTSDGTIDGTGVTIGDANADWRVSSAETVPTNDSTGSTTQPDGSRVQALLGRILAGPEYLTVFDGLTGRALATANYVPSRGRSMDWGDDYGNRVDRFLAGVAYLDGQRPSLIMCRGYYTRTVLVAWDWRDGKLTQRWKFDTRTETTPGSPAPGFSNWEEMGNHQLSIADVDEDGRDEIVYGAMVVDDDGRGLYTTGRGHGDAFHVSDMDPDRPGLEAYGPHETARLYGQYGSEMRDARTGVPLWGASGQGADVGRGVAFDIDPRYRGYEGWSSRGGLYSAKGELITNSRPNQMNFGIWWDADPLREILDGTTISKWDWTRNATNTLFSATGSASNNGTKSTPALTADLLGDWREEMVFRSADNRELRIYTTTIPATNRLYTLMHDPQYRLAVAWQNTAYNQPPHPGFYLGDGMSRPPTPLIRTLPRPGRLTNLSVRTAAGTGPDTLIVGFNVSGNGSQRLLLRGVG
ncbi:MAG: rhamnogalacturonan lyase, partial [Opitutaceae bacterium]